jgi:hypothetical protein
VDGWASPPQTAREWNELASLQSEMSARVRGGEIFRCGDAVPKSAAQPGRNCRTARSLASAWGAPATRLAERYRVHVGSVLQILA